MFYFNAVSEQHECALVFLGDKVVFPLLKLAIFHYDLFGYKSWANKTSDLSYTAKK